MRTDTAERADLDTLTALNADYIRSVQQGDVRRFDQILAENFLCPRSSWRVGRKE